MIKVLVADDHDIVRSGISKLLNAEDGIRVVGEAESGEDAIKLTKRKNPDVVLMDLKIPGIGGIEATRKLVRYHPQLKVIAFTGYEGEIYSMRIMQAGAMGYITKGASINQIVRAIRNVSTGQRYFSAEIVQRLADNSFSLSDNESPFEALSDRELQVCMMIVTGTKTQDAAEQLCISSKTVNTYRYRLFSKLKVSSDVELTLLAIHHSLIDKPNE